MNITQAMLDVCEEALYHLRQDVTLPALADASADTGMEWVKCRRAFDYAAAEVLSAHDWRFARSSETAQDKVDDWPQNVRKVLVYCLARELAVQIAGRTEDLKNLHQLYTRFLFDAKLKDLEEDKSSDAVCKEVVATLRGYFSEESKDIPRSMVSIYERIDAVRESAFREILAAHNWQGKDDMAGGDDLPPQARAAWIALIEQKLCVACGLSSEAAASFESVWRAKVKEARVTDLETSEMPEGVAGEVLTLIRDSFDPAETNLPMDLETLAARVERMKPIAMKEVLSAHPWAFAADEWVTGSARTALPGVGEYAHAVPVPGDCIKVIGVYGRDGGLLKWECVAGEIRADGPVARLTYVRNVEELGEFSPDCYRLVVLRLAADMTRAMSLRASLQNLHENVYRDALAEAKCRDARQSNPGPAAVWGGNYYVDRMDGRRG